MSSIVQFMSMQPGQILDYKQTIAPGTFHWKVHNVAVNPVISKLSLMDGKLALLHLFCIKGFIFCRNISINNTCGLKGFCRCHYPNSRDITWSVEILANALPFYITPFYVSWFTCSDHSFYSWGSVAYLITYKRFKGNLHHVWDTS